MRLDVFRNRVRGGSHMAGRVFGLPDQVAVAVVAMVSAAAGLGVVSAQSAAAPALAPGHGALSAVEDAGCFRPLTDVVYGFVVTLLVCSGAYWGRRKHRTLGKWEKITAALVAVFTPIRDLYAYIWASFENATLIWKYQQSRQPLQRPSRRHQFQELCSCLSPLSKFPGRILFWCDVVVYVEKKSPLLKKGGLWLEKGIVQAESEALVIGEVAAGKTKDVDYERKELSYEGIIALMVAEVLPDYDELKFLRGNSGFATIAIAVQALGYIYAVVFREVKDLPVAPLEVVGLILNIILFIEVGVYSFFNPCHRPLVIYTNSERVEKLLKALEKIKKTNTSRKWINVTANPVISVVGLCLCGLVVYFIVTLIQVSNIFVVLPLIVFAIAIIISTITSVFEHFFGDVFWKYVGYWSAILLCIVVYIWALVATVVYWKVQHFDARAELLNISQLIPFIGKNSRKYREGQCIKYYISTKPFTCSIMNILLVP